MISVKNLSFSYRSKNIIDNVSFKIVKGEILGILGPNGTGKTTLFKLLNKMLEPKSGTIHLNEKSLDTIPVDELSRSMALVPQNPSSNFSYTVEELITMGRRPYSSLFSGYTKKDLEIVNDIIERTGLNDFRERPSNQLSGGERQLIFLARAFVQQPEILLLDEATSSLDVNHTLHIFSLVKEKVKNEALSVVAIIHDINLAAIFCDKILFLSEGKIDGPELPGNLVNLKTLKEVYKVKEENINIQNDPLRVNYNL